MTYAVQPERNIALAHNTAVSHATGEFIAIIDDDEFPAPNWLLNLFRTCQAHQVAGVLGPVKPRFEHQPPQWLIKGGFYQRPTHPTGFVMPWEECRTGNVLFRRDILDSSEPPFRREFGSGGSDVDFFCRFIERGHCFIWCDEAVVFEVVPPSRWSRRFMIHRALLGSMERFFATLIEHYGGDFPVWLAPVQVRLITIADAQIPLRTGANRVCDGGVAGHG